MSPDPELLAEATGSRAAAWAPVSTGGYTRSLAWSVELPDGIAFVKEAEDEGSLFMLRREAVVYGSVRGAFLPAFVGFADRGDRALLAIEHLAGAHWPPPYPDDTAPLLDALAEVASTSPPEDLPSQEPRASSWERVASDPRPFLGLGLCSPAWLEDALDPLLAAEGGADFTGGALVHNDVYSANVCFTGRGAVLVDWGASVRGSPCIDLALALLSVRVEGGVPPQADLGAVAPFLAAFAGHFAVEAPAPLPDWAEPGSTLREDMALDLAHSLAWCVELLDLPPLF